MQSETLYKIIPIGDKLESHSHSTVAYEGGLYMFGGKKYVPTYLDFFNCSDWTGQICNDLYRYDVNTGWRTTEIVSGTKPTPRCDHSAVVYKTSMFVFGGKDEQGLKNDLFEYHFPTKTWTCIVFSNCDLPQPRYGHMAAVYGDQLWIYSGKKNSETYNDMWTLRLWGRTWEKVEQKGICALQSVCNDCPMVVKGDHMYVLVKTNVVQLFCFNFKDLSWSNLKDPPITKTPQALVAVAHQLFAFESSSSVLHCYDSNSQIWSVISSDSGSNIPGENLPYNTAGVFEDGMYLQCTDGSLPPGTSSNGNNIPFGSRLYKVQFFIRKHLGSTKILVHEGCSIHEDFGKILASRLFPADVEFLVGEKEIKIGGHVAIAAARSQWLRACIRDALVIEKKSVSSKDLQMLQVKIPKAIPEVFEMMLNFIYTDQFDVPEEGKKKCDLLLYLDLYSLAKQIDWKNLEQMILEQLTDQFLDGLITASNVFDILSKANHMEILAIKEYCLRFLVDDINCNNILKSKEIEALDSNLVLEIMRRKLDPVNVSSDILPKAKRAKTSDSNRFAEDMEVFLTSVGEEFSDITLLVGGYSVPAHKCILAARSSYFEAMFRSLTPHDNIIRIQIGEMLISKDAFDVLLKYIYYDDLNIPIEHSFILYLAADFYGLRNNRLPEFIKENVKKNATFEQIVQMLGEAHLTQQSDLKTFLLELIVEKCPNISAWPRPCTFASQELWIDILDALVVEKQ